MEDRVTKKHFIEFARYIKAQVGITSDTDLRTFADIVMKVAENDNPRFDRDRFMKACGL